jgi:hypothetical protein
LKKAEEIAQVSRTILGETNNAREKALKVGADKLGEPYMDVEKKYLKLTKSIENDNLSYAQKNAADVQAAFRDVEIMAIKNNALSNARNMMAEADKAKIQKIAPTGIWRCRASLERSGCLYREKSLCRGNDQPESRPCGVHGATDDDDRREQQEVSGDDTGSLRPLSWRACSHAWKTMNTGDLRDKSTSTPNSAH